VTSPPATRPITSTPTTDQSQPEHASTDQSSNQQRFTTTSRTTHLRITIRWFAKGEQSRHSLSLISTLVVDLEGKDFLC
jgi:hypothetical protein